jgi:ADP-heptose:LPS heptosyltransferase
VQLGDLKMSENVMTPDKLEKLAKKALQNYMLDIKENGGVDHEQALYGLFLRIVVTLETQHGRLEAKRVMKEFLDDIYSVA